MPFLGRRLVRVRRLDELEQRCRAYEAIVQAVVSDSAQAGSQPPLWAAGVVFSRDRPLQLDALLCSYRELVVHPAPLHILYRATSEQYAGAYAEVFARHPWLAQPLCRECDFRADLISTVQSLDAARVFFLVDDLLFVRRADLAALGPYSSSTTVVSLRLGRHLEYCYTHDRPQPLPPFDRVGEGLLRWRWSDGVLDWGYPLSLDGHLFGRAEVLAMLEAVEFSSPNSLETALQRFRRMFLPRFGLCLCDAPLVNIPFNRVQSDYANRAGTVEPEWLLAQWREGRQLDYRSYYGLRNRSAHEEQPLRLIPREDPPAGVGQ